MTSLARAVSGVMGHEPNSGELHAYKYLTIIIVDLLSLDELRSSISTRELRHCDLFFPPVFQNVRGITTE